MTPTEIDSDYMEILSMTDERAVRKLVHQAVYQLWSVVDNLTRLRPQHDSYRVIIFGSSQMPPESLLYGEVRRLARELAVMGCSIVTGGGSGLMQAANEGATSGGANDRCESIGISIDFDFTCHPNPYVRTSYPHRTFFSRLHHFVLLSDAFVVVPGGIGTLMETMMVWQLLQARKLHGTPLILVGSMWAEMVDWARTHMLEVEVPMLAAADMTIPQCVPDVDAALAVIRDHYDARIQRPSGEKAPV
jgi:uncharacterized protein (TIGR00730 family)